MGDEAGEHRVSCVSSRVVAMRGELDARMRDAGVADDRVPAPAIANGRAGGDALLPHVSAAGSQPCRSERAIDCHRVSAPGRRQVLRSLYVFLIQGLEGPLPAQRETRRVAGDISTGASACGFLDLPGAVLVAEVDGTLQFFLGDAVLMRLRFGVCGCSAHSGFEPGALFRCQTVQHSGRYGEPPRPFVDESGLPETSLYVDRLIGDAFL